MGPGICSLFFLFWLLTLCQDHVEPMVVEFLEGFTWSQFVLDDAVISLAGLVPLPPLYRPSLGIWTVVSLGHVVKVTENSRVFVKSIEVQHCKDLADHTIALTSQFRGRLDVTRERVEKFNLVYIWSRVLTNSLLTRTILLTVILFVLASTSTE